MSRTKDKGGSESMASTAIMSMTALSAMTTVAASSRGMAFVESGSRYLLADLPIAALLTLAYCDRRIAGNDHSSKRHPVV